MKDPYSLLGVSRDASQSEIKKAYRKLAKKLHPDLHPDDNSVSERFKEVTAAYDLLGDKAKRARYDRGEIDAGGAERVNAHFHRGHARAGADTSFFEDLGFGGINTEDLFGDLFQGLRGGGRARATRSTRGRGADRAFTVKVNFLDAVKGCKQRLSMPGGKTLDVTVPAGIEEGRTIRLKRQGEPGRGGGAAGDALIQVKVEPHRFFTRKGRDIHVEAAVTLSEAVLGAKITVPTIHGSVSVKVPKASNTGTTLRLKGKGIANPKSGKRGDQYVRLKVMLPDKPDPELERLIAEWAESHEYEVREDLKAD